ncbi:MAG: UDP-N-acetylglucosamine--N-acetylmuramyl-(pentapeptide) pyrophosphoryl-undecaprenol N-acetylglucosamine transferase [Spirochaetota bacterium]
MEKKRAATKERTIASGPTLLIAAGGTGGHITPGISIAEEWLAQGGRVILATLVKNVEYPDIIRLARNEAVSIVAYDAPRLVKNPLHLWGFFRRFRAAYRLVRQASLAEGTVAIVGMGGYSSFPSVAYAVLNRLPLFLCEQNARWGIVTRLLRFFARRIFLSFPTGQKLPEKFVVTGNPLRSLFQKAKAPKKPAGRTRTIFFVGGSQGAQDINALYQAFCAAPEAKNYRCIVSTGPQQHAEISRGARRGDDIRPFIVDMPETLLKADFVVARCGSGTLSELVWAQKPAFLIPFPFAAANHQRANADAVASKLDCMIFDERPFRPSTALKGLLGFLQSHPQARGAALKPASANASAAQHEIVRYIKEEL